MNEAQAYKIAAFCLEPIQSELVPSHKYQQSADRIVPILIAKTIQEDDFIEAWMRLVDYITYWDGDMDWICNCCGEYAKTKDNIIHENGCIVREYGDDWKEKVMT